MRYCFSVPTITEYADGQLDFVDYVEVGIEQVGTRHCSHPTFDGGIVTLCYDPLYDTRIWTQQGLPNNDGAAKFGCQYVFKGSDAFQECFIWRPISW